MEVGAAADELFGTLAARADPDFAVGMQRYFPYEIGALGVSNAAVVEIANDYFRDRRDVPAATRLLLAEEVLGRAQHHEEVLLGFAVLHKVAKARARRGAAGPLRGLARDVRVELGAVR